MNEGKFKKRIKQEQVGIGISDRGVVYCSQLERWIDEAKKEFPMYDSCFDLWKTSFPSDKLRIIVDLDTFVNEEREKWFLKWFGDPK